MNNPSESSSKKWVLIGVVAVVVVVLALIFLLGGKSSSESNQGNYKEPNENTGNDWCIVGKQEISDEGDSLDVLGKEQITIKGNKYTVCCGVMTLDIGGTKMKRKTCASKDKKVSIMYDYDSETGNWKKNFETYPYNGKICTISYDEQGNPTETCS